MPKAVMGQGLTEQVDFKKWAQTLYWVWEAKSKLPFFFFSRKAKIHLFSMSFPNLPRREGVGWEEEGVLEHRNITCKCRQNEMTLAVPVCWWLASPLASLHLECAVSHTSLDCRLVVSDVDSATFFRPAVFLTLLPTSNIFTLGHHYHGCHHFA